jgi:hypothetical protein
VPTERSLLQPLGDVYPQGLAPARPNSWAQPTPANDRLSRTYSLHPLGAFARRAGASPFRLADAYMYPSRFATILDAAGLAALKQGRQASQCGPRRATRGTDALEGTANEARPSREVRGAV